MSLNDQEHLLNQLDGFPLLPVGAGEEGKAPVNPHTGLELSGWTTARFTPEQILGFNGSVTAVGTRTGPDAEYLAIVDIDGNSAVQRCIAAGAFAKAAGWAIRRTTDAHRLKVAFYVPPELRHLFTDANGEPIGKKVMQTRPPVHELDDDGQPKRDHNNRLIRLEKQEALELFYGSGQCVVLGLHKPSGGQYTWEGSPTAIAEPNQAWLDLMVEILELSAASTERLHAPGSGDSHQSGPGEPCVICGRNSTAACTTYNDGERVRINCFEGQTFNPIDTHGALDIGQTIEGSDGKTYAFCGQFFNGSIGGFSKFAEHIEREEQPPFDVEEGDDGITPAELLQLSEQLAEGRRMFTLDMLLPAPLAHAVELLQRSLPTDPLSAALPLMCGYSGLLKLNTRVSSSHSFSKPANLFLACILRTGLAKTSIKNTLLDAPAAGAKKTLARAHERAREEWKEANKGKPKDEKSPQPIAVFAHITDYSPAALYRQLHINETSGLGQLLIRDELSAMFSRMAADTKGGSGDGEGQLLELFDGDGYTGLRVAEGARSFDACHVSLYGNVQPEVLKELINGDDATGKFARFLFCRVPVRPLVLDDDDPTPEELALYNAAKDLLRSYADQIFALPPRTYRFNKEARKQFHAWFNQHQQRSILPGTPKVVAALLGKTSAHALRLAGVMHILRIISGDSTHDDLISAETVDVAMAVVDQLTRETEAFHEQPVSGDGDGTSAIDLMRHVHELSWFTKKSVSRQDCRDKGGRPIRRELKTAVFKQVIDELVSLKYGEIDAFKAPNGKNTIAYKATREMPA